MLRSLPYRQIPFPSPPDMDVYKSFWEAFNVSAWLRMITSPQKRVVFKRDRLWLDDYSPLGWISCNWPDTTHGQCTESQRALQVEEEDSNLSWLLNTLHLQLNFSDADLHEAHVYIARVSNYAVSSFAPR